MHTLTDERAVWKFSHFSIRITLCASLRSVVCTDESRAGWSDGTSTFGDTNDRLCAMMAHYYIDAWALWWYTWVDWRLRPGNGGKRQVVTENASRVRDARQVNVWSRAHEWTSTKRWYVVSVLLALWMRTSQFWVGQRIWFRLTRICVVFEHNCENIATI